MGRKILGAEAEALSKVASSLNGDFASAARVVAECPGRLVVSGMGKANFVAQKISSTFASTGCPSLFLHPADALHGDLGRIAKDDVLLLLSHSGETDEVLRLVSPVRRVGAKILAITASKASSLGKNSDLTIEMGRWEEAGTGLAPTTSTTVMLAIGDALAMAVLELRGFSEDEFRQVHPAGALGRQLMLVEEVMRSGEAVPVVRRTMALREVISVMTTTPGRPGAALVVDGRGRLAGIFTDGDLRRLVEHGTLDVDVPVGEVMCAKPKTIRPDQQVRDAAHVLRGFRVDQVPVVDSKDRPVGLLDVQDLLAQRFI